MRWLRSSMPLRSPKSDCTCQWGATGPRYTTRTCPRGGWGSSSSSGAWAMWPRYSLAVFALPRGALAQGDRHRALRTAALPADLDPVAGPVLPDRRAQVIGGRHLVGTHAG